MNVPKLPSRYTGVVLIVLLSSFVVTHSFIGLSTARRWISFGARHRPHHYELVAPLQAAGMGMAVAKRKKDKKNKAKNVPFDVGASLMRLGKKYDELSLNSAKALKKDDDSIVTTEYVICARSANTVAASDWIPVAQLCLARPSGEVDSSLLQAVVSNYCREIFHAATLSAPVFKGIPRNEVEYSVESLDSFQKFVYEPIVETSQDKNGDTMTKADARKVLQLQGEGVENMAVIKKAYRTLSFQYHPDRFVGETNDEIESASAAYHTVKLAYETLSSGSGSSWYESLGGRARTEFLRIELLSLETAREFLSSHTLLDSAVAGLDPEMVQTFIIRNQNSI